MVIEVPRYIIDSLRLVGPFVKRFISRTRVCMCVWERALTPLFCMRYPHVTSL